jgi:RNA polymerase sigma-70 factor (ECF subfamily)
LKGAMMTDETLANRVDVLVQSKARFLKFLERRLGNRADAEDVLQEAFLKLVAHESSLRDEDNLVSWFYQLLRNLIVDHYRHRDAVTRVEQSVAAETASTTTGVDEALFTAVCKCVQDLIPALKAEHSELVRRVELGEEPLHQVASDLGITPNNASVRLHRARRTLREALQATCGACADHGCLDCGCRGAAHQ